jgi:hypothetical protein
LLISKATAAIESDHSARRMPEKQARSGVCLKNRRNALRSRIGMALNLLIQRYFSSETGLAHFLCSVNQPKLGAASLRPLVRGRRTGRG